jgi:M6 family metalloprotease-like protein
MAMRFLRIVSIYSLLLFLYSSTSSPVFSSTLSEREFAAMLDQVTDSLVELQSETGDSFRGLQHQLDSIHIAFDRWRDQHRPGQPGNALKALEKRLKRVAIKIDKAFGDIGNNPTPVAIQDEFTLRTEPQLGTPNCSADEINDEAAQCSAGPWLATRSTNFVNIKKTHYFRSSSPTVSGVQMSGSFTVERNQTDVVFHFSAESYVRQDGERLWIRALVDASPAQPDAVVFATGNRGGTHSFMFHRRLNKGIHTVQIQWKVDPGATGYIRNATLLTHMGSGAGFKGMAVDSSNNSVHHDQNAWQDVPGLDGSVFVPGNGVVDVSLSAESKVSDGGSLVLRALIGNTVLKPANVVFARGEDLRSRTATFGGSGLPVGNHQVRFQWAVNNGAATLGRRSITLNARSASKSKPARTFVAAPSGPSIETNLPLLVPVQDMNTTVHIPDRGNGQVAVLFNAEILSSGGGQVFAGLSVDGFFQSETLTELFDGQGTGHLKSHIFEAKGLTPGPHDIQILWEVLNGSKGFMGDRAMAVMSETGHVPDLAEALRFGGGHIGVSQDNIGGIEPMVGTRAVLAVLLDYGLCDVVTDPDGDIGFPIPCEEPGKHNMSREKVQAALFGLGGGGGFVDPGLIEFQTNNVRKYLRRNSGNRFNISNAGVLGWFDAPKPASHYLEEAHAAKCDQPNDGFLSAGVEAVSHAVQFTDAFVDYSSFDTNGDKELALDELAIIVVFPRDNGDGSVFSPLRLTECPDKRIEFDGVTLPRSIAKWNTSLDNDKEVYQFTTAAHELMHVLAGLDDIYVNDIRVAQGEVEDNGSNETDAFDTDLSDNDDDRWKNRFLKFTSGNVADEKHTVISYAAAAGRVAFAGDGFAEIPDAGSKFDIIKEASYSTAAHAAVPWRMGLMAANRRTTTHINPLTKLALGWVTPQMITGTGDYKLKRVEDGDRVFILPRFNHEGSQEEFYILENRQEGVAGLFDDNLPNSGVAVWHIVSDMNDNLHAPLGVTQAAFDSANRSPHTPASKGQMGRRGIRMLRSWTRVWHDGGATTNGLTTWGKGDYSLQSAPCILPYSGPDFITRNTLTWADCAASGYGIDFESFSSTVMPLHIDVPQ